MSWKNLKIKHQWQKQNPVKPKHTTGLNYPFTTDPKRIDPLPVKGQMYQYIGRTSSLWTYGELYIVIDYGIHWDPSVGFTIWLSDNEYPNNNSDIDYGVAIHPKDFFKEFLIC